MTDLAQQLSFFNLALEITPKHNSELFPFSDEQNSYLQGPVILHGRGGNSWPPPDWLRSEISAARWIQVLKELRDPTIDKAATTEEVLAYLQSAAFEAPLSDEDSQVMFWCCAQILPRVRPNEYADADAVFKEIGVPQHDRTLSPYLNREVLLKLKFQIRAATVKHYKQRR